MKTKQKKVRLKDIADLANVSTATVSIILKNPETKRVSVSKRKEVIEIANKLNYVPNIMAQGLVSNRTNTIGLIVPDLENPFFAKLAKCIETYARKSNYTVIITNTDNDYSNDIKMISYLYHRGVDGIVLAASANSYGNEKEVLEAINNIDVPIIIADRSLKGFKGNQVVFDNRLGTEIATQYCIDQGHRKIGFISTRDSSYNGYFRHQGYQDALKKNGIEYDESIIYFGNFDFETGEHAATFLAGSSITAVVATNDLIAFSFKKQIEMEGFNIPQDISIIGFDNLDINNYINDGVTSINLDIDELSIQTLNALIRVIEEAAEVSRILIKPTIHIRNSVLKI